MTLVQNVEKKEKYYLIFFSLLLLQQGVFISYKKQY